MGAECRWHRSLPPRSPALCRLSTCECGLFFFNQLNCVLGIHGEIGQRLVHVYDKMPVAICNKDDLVHKQHEVKGLALDFGRHALQCVRTHSIGKQMGNHEAFHGATVRCEARCAELWQEKQNP